MATTTTKTKHDNDLAGMIDERMQTAADSLDLALRDLEEAAGIAISAKYALSPEERLAIIKKARELRNFAGFINDRLETLERTAIY